MTAAPAYVGDDDQLVKVVITGGLGAGKTTFLKNVSTIRAMLTEAQMTSAAESTDRATDGKTHTTTGIDFGRLHLAPEPVWLYLFGTPGQDRLLKIIFSTVAKGAEAVLVMADVRNIEACHEALRLTEDTGIPYCVVVNRFPDSPPYPDEDVRDALDLPPHVPLLWADARDADQGRKALVTLFEHAYTLAADPPATPPQEITP